MYGPTHGSWCGSRSWPTKCPTCGHSVFFFMCNCGSRVFFDELGPPWPLHDCDTSWVRGLKRTVSASGAITVQLSHGVSITRPAASFAVDAGLLSNAKRHATGRSAPDPITAVKPSSEEPIHIVGVVREIIKSKSPYKHYGVAEGTIGAVFLGPLAAMAVARITIHTPTWPGGPLSSYTMWVPQELVSDARVVLGITISAAASVLSIGGQLDWFIEELHVVG